MVTRPPKPVPAKGGAAERLLRVLHSAGRPLAAKPWAVLAGLSVKGGTWSTYLSRLRSRGLITQVGDRFSVSPAGLPFCAGATPLDPGAVRQQWVEALGAGAAGRVLAHLVAAYPRAVPAADVAGALGITTTGGTWSTYVSRCVSSGLVVRQHGKLQASPDLFPERAGG